MAIQYDPALVDKYVKIRDALGEAKKAFDKETERMKKALEVIEGVFQKKMEEDGLEQIANEYGTVYAKVRSSCTVKDRGEFYDFAVSTNNLGLIDMKANAKAVRELLQDGVEVPGVKFTEIKQINVRRK